MGNRAKADALMKEAEKKLAKRSFFGGGDLKKEEAAESFVRCGNMFKLDKAYVAAVAMAQCTESHTQGVFFRHAAGPRPPQRTCVLLRCNLSVPTCPRLARVRICPCWSPFAVPGSPCMFCPFRVVFRRYFVHGCRLLRVLDHVALCAAHVAAPRPSHAPPRFGHPPTHQRTSPRRAASRKRMCPRR